MKTRLTLLLILIVGTTSGQWFLNPSGPQTVSQVSCKQDNVKAIPDGANGVYVFWSDSHVDGCSSGYFNDIFGQHYNSEGVAQWEVNGRS
ncbi:MAG: hypothetical protein JNM00_07230, partial [Flavobacteriales bacterium]|nr:hypothetical protein [Flavobacteriales bacterium]